uniref:Transmembrane 9 superfamily member n=1 Tax=Acrobeloides nanus TaxID=290746 RepID=A0A914E0N1_9BILA
MHNRIFLLVFFILLPRWDCFYVPGVAPKEFKEGESIEVKAIKLTSIKTVVPYEYYSLPFCKSEKIHYKSENFGELLRGDRIVNTPYEISMKIDSKCKGLCHEQKTKRLDAAETDRLRKRIVEDYHVHLLVDNLPCATRYVVPETNEVFFDHGYKLGWTEGDKVFVNNHLEILLKYHEPQPGVYRVVGFEVQPKSISRDKFTFKEGLNDCTIGGEESQEVRAGENEIAWTYSVKWESSEVPWASRWDIYLSMKDVQIHWFSILNSVVVIACLTGFFSVIIIRTVRRDINKYNRDDEIEDTLEETGWKLVHGDVFRPPRYSMLLVNFVGTGIQLLVMTIAIISFAMLGMLSPSNRGSLTSVAIFVYCFMGLIAGYHSGRLYKTFRGNKPKRAAFR